MSSADGCCVVKATKALKGKDGKEAGLSWQQGRGVKSAFKDARGHVGEAAGAEVGWTEPLKRYAENETGQRSLLGDGEQAPSAYHVDRRGLDPSGVEATFG
ncbi:hypothetical protein [Streptomyces lydicus]|uniref:hypothetical protein n=1 Tax=Streptomyces lydicus TaxID=47763 RepID=UPI0010125D9D|nr:hypothetical protein [Streptomyces lydicus]MCZ1011087.1 hypothetical protein [Streptomyces lydicus]